MKLTSNAEIETSLLESSTRSMSSIDFSTVYSTLYVSGEVIDITTIYATPSRSSDMYYAGSVSKNYTVGTSAKVAKVAKTAVTTAGGFIKTIGPVISIFAALEDIVDTITEDTIIKSIGVSHSFEISEQVVFKYKENTIVGGWDQMGAYTNISYGIVATTFSYSVDGTTTSIKPSSENYSGSYIYNPSHVSSSYMYQNRGNGQVLIECLLEEYNIIGPDGKKIPKADLSLIAPIAPAESR